MPDEEAILRKHAATCRENAERAFSPEARRLLVKAALQFEADADEIALEHNEKGRRN